MRLGPFDNRQDMKSKPFFEETQKFPSRIYIALAVPPCILLGLAIWQVGFGHVWDKPPMSKGRLIGWTVFTSLIYVRLITVRLVTAVRSNNIIVSIRGLWRSRSIPISDIRSIKAVTYDAVADYGGYGMRSGRNGKAYIADGNEGVQLGLTTGGTILVGSRRSRELADAIKGACAADLKVRSC
jgi:hypothetical protein